MVLQGRICLFRYTGRIRTKVSNKTDGTMAFYLNTFVELLCDLHGFSSSKVQRLDASCCKVDVVNGRGGFLFLSLFLMEETLYLAPFNSAMILSISSLDRISAFSGLP